MTTITNMIVQAFARIREEEKGQGLVEYALIISLVAVVLIGALQALALDIDGVFTSITTSL